MAEKLNISTLEFNAIKTNLKNFLREQSQFTDYDFEGSSLSVLIDLLAYNTFYNAYYSNMIANEMFIDTAIIRDSVLSHAKILNYVPRSRTASKAVVNLTVTPPAGNFQPSIIVPRFTEFQSQALDGINYTFVTTEAYSTKKQDDVFFLENVEIFEGVPKVLTFEYNVNSVKPEFFIDDENVDITTIKVSVRPSIETTDSVTYVLADNITEINGNSACYFIEPTNTNKYKIVFGDGILGKALQYGNIITVSFISTNGDLADNISLFASNIIDGFSNVNVEIVTASYGGAERESVDSIKFSAPKFYTAQNRAVTSSDYESLVRRFIPDIESVSVWGGEENNPPVYGKAYISYKLNRNVILSDIEKERIVEQYIKPYSVVSITPELIDPDFLYIKYSTNVQANRNLTNLSSAQLTSLIRNSILNYNNVNLGLFGSIFSTSKLQRAVDDTDKSIIGSDGFVRIEKRFEPVLNSNKQYRIDFGFPLVRGNDFNEKLQSSSFEYVDLAGVTRVCYLEENDASSSGIDFINITNSGYGYTETPQVVITGDGTGATATCSLVNGKIERITITNRGTGYTRAVISFVGGGGRDAAATAIIQSKFGAIDLIYYNDLAEKIVLTNSIGSVDYIAGTVILDNFRPKSVGTNDNKIAISARPQVAILESKRNQIILIDDTDPSSISINVGFR